MQLELIKVVLTVLGLLTAPFSLIFYLARDRYLGLEKSVTEHEERHAQADIRFEEMDKEHIKYNHKMELKINTLESQKISQDQLDEAISGVKESVRDEFRELREDLREDKQDAIRREDALRDFLKTVDKKLDRLAEK